MQMQEQVGRATRTVREDGTELWRLAANEQQAVQWLTWFGARGVGGFTSSGQDPSGWWLIRAAVPSTLADWFRSQTSPVPWAQALPWVRKIAELVAACEDRQLFPGLIVPQAVGFDPHSQTLSLQAQALVRQLVGAPFDPNAAMHSASLSTSRWIAPEQASGAPADPASNRYLLGLILYRFLANADAFSGQGLRLGLEQAQRGAAPLPDEIASQLPPGLQSLCLQLLDPDPAKRPATAQVVADKLTAFLEAPAPQPRQTTGTVFASEPAAPVAPSGLHQTGRVVPPKASGGAKTWRRRIGTIASILLPATAGIGIALGLLSAVPNKKSKSRATPQQTANVGAVEPLTAKDTTVKACSSCHPQQTAQWYGSVMGHAAKSPLFQALEILIEEQIGRDNGCPGGAGALRPADRKTACTNPANGLPITGSGGALWCVNCHMPRENLSSSLPAWNGRARKSKTQRPLRDLLPDDEMQGIDCGFCHQVRDSVRPGNQRKGKYEGNPNWQSFLSGEIFSMRPEDRKGEPGIANSGYFLDPDELLVRKGNDGERVPSGVHMRPSKAARKYLRSSQFCGGCHDVRLFGTDGIGIKKGEHFKRLRNAYTEWANWADDEKKAGREPASCMDCHMSTFPGICAPGEPAVDQKYQSTVLATACPDGTHFEERNPGDYPQGHVAAGASAPSKVTTHFFSGVDLPLAAELDPNLGKEGLDPSGMPLDPHKRRDILLGRTFKFRVSKAKRRGSRLTAPVIIENVLAGHKVPAGFSQEREFWVHLRVTDGKGKLVYEVGRVDQGDEDLHDKVFVKINTDPNRVDEQGRPIGLFGADVKEGKDHPQWSPSPELGGTKFRGKGLINLQNGFLRCVSCIGIIAADGSCQPANSAQKRTKAARYTDGVFDLDSGECKSNLDEHHRFFETYYPVTSLDASRGFITGPDAIIDTRSASPGVPLRYTYELDVGKRPGPFKIDARLMFRAFPPFLLRAFIDYERHQTEAGKRPSGPLVTEDVLSRIEVVELHRVTVEVD